MRTRIYIYIYMCMYIYIHSYIYILAYIYIRECGQQFIIQTSFIKRKMTIEEAYFQSDFFYFSKFQFCSFWTNAEDNKRHPCWDKLFTNVSDFVCFKFSALLFFLEVNGSQNWSNQNNYCTFPHNNFRIHAC